MHKSDRIRFNCGHDRTPITVYIYVVVFCTPASVYTCFLVYWGGALTFYYNNLRITITPSPTSSTIDAHSIPNTTCFSYDLPLSSNSISLGLGLGLRLG